MDAEKQHVVRNAICCIAGCLKGIEVSFTNGDDLSDWIESIEVHLQKLKRIQEP